MTKAQLDRVLDLLERFTEAHEAVAEALVMNTPTNSPAYAGADAMVPETASETEPAPQGETDDSSSDPFSLGGDGSDATAPASDDPGLDITDKKAVEAFRETLGALMREFGGLANPETALELIEEVTGSKKFSDCPPDKLNELHDAVYDAIAEKEA